MKTPPPTNESSGEEDLCTTFGHLTNEEPSEVQEEDIDDHMVRRIAVEMKNDYN